MEEQKIFCMNYLATKLPNITFKQLDNLSEEDQEKYNSLRIRYPLIFVTREHSIVFFTIPVHLDQVEYDVLIQLINNATKNNGLSSEKLFKLAKCKHTKIQSKNLNLTETQRADERIRSIKSRIRNKINKAYKFLQDEYDKEVEFYKEISKKRNTKDLLKKEELIRILSAKYQKNEDYVRTLLSEDMQKNLIVLNNIDCMGFQIINGRKYFSNEEITEDSIYYNFDIESAIELLFAKQKGRKYNKHTTNFIFS